MTKKRKAFASTIFAGLAVLVIALSAAAVLSTQESELNAKKLFQAKQAAWLFTDAEGVLENAFADAEVDSAYAAYGCAVTVPDFCNAIQENASTYLQNALADLNALTRFASVSNESGFVVACLIVSQTTGSETQSPGLPESAPAPAANVEEKNFSVNLSFSLKTNSSASVKTERVEYKHLLNFLKDTSNNKTSFRISVVDAETGLIMVDLLGNCGPTFTLVKPPTASPQALPSTQFEATPTPPALPQSSPYAFTPTPPTALEPPTLTPTLAAIAAIQQKPTPAATRKPPAETRAAAPNYTLFALVLLFFALLAAAYYFKKKNRGEPKSLAYLARQRNRF